MYFCHSNDCANNWLEHLTKGKKKCQIYCIDHNYTAKENYTLKQLMNRKSSFDVDIKI